MRASALFRSFWLAGFESACHINRQGARLDLVCATQHDLELEADYARVRALGLGTVRESARWHLVDRGRRMDFSTVRPMRPRIVPPITREPSRSDFRRTSRAFRPNAREK